MATIGARRYELVEVESLEGGAMKLRFESPFNEGKIGITVHLTAQEAEAKVNWQAHIPVTGEGLLAAKNAERS